MENDGICRFYELKKGEEHSFKVDSSKEWIANILNELQEQNKEQDFNEIEQSELCFEATIYKATGSQFGDYIVISGHVAGKYQTYDVQTGEAMLAPIDIEIKACCIDDENKDKFELEDELEINIKDEPYELFFFDGKKANIGDIIREIIFLEKDEYPTIDQ